MSEKASVVALRGPSERLTFCTSHVSNVQDDEKLQVFRCLALKSEIQGLIIELQGKKHSEFSEKIRF